MKILLFANSDWYLYNFRLALAQALQSRGDEVVLVSPGGEYASRLQQMGFRWVCFPLARRGLNPFIEIITILRLTILYKQEKPDIVHHFTVKCVLYGSLASHLLGIRSVVNSITGLGYVFAEGQRSRQWLVKPILLFYRIILRRTMVIFQNPDDRAIFLENHLVDPERVMLIRGSGVDTRLFSPQPEPESSTVIILPARLLWDKGVGEFVEAARLLQDEFPLTHFVLVGNIDLDNPAAVPVSQVKEWEKEGVIKWWGWQDNMEAIYAQAHIVCLPSKYREGVPKTLIEAAACGRPIVTSDAPGCREIVQDGKNGLLVPVGDVSTLVESLKLLIQSPILRQTMGACGRRIVEQEFSNELVIIKTIAVYSFLEQLGN